MALTVVAGIQPLQNLRLLAKMGEKKMEWARSVIERGFESLAALWKIIFLLLNFIVSSTGDLVKINCRKVLLWR